MAPMTGPSLPPCPAEAVEAAVEAMLGTVAVARALVGAGRRVDLEGLDGEIGALCAAAIALPVEEGRTLRPAVQALLESIEGLAAALRLASDAPA